MKKWLKPSLCFTAAGLILITGITYSWLTSKEDHRNMFNMGTVHAQIVEQFENVEDWKGGEEKVKELVVLNRGSMDVLLRVSLNEKLVLYELDTANGNLKPDEISQTWQGEICYPYQNRIPQIHAYIMITGGISLGTEMLADGSYPDWIYDDGTNAYYYTKKIKPGECTTPLLRYIKLEEEADNRYKGADYSIQADSHAIIPAADYLSDPAGWGLAADSAAYQALLLAADS